MKTINIKISLVDDMPKLSSEDDGTTIGTMWDNLAQKLDFQRPSGFEDHNLTLIIESEGFTWPYNLHKGNSYIITDNNTRSSSIRVRTVFSKDGNEIQGANALSFKYRDSARPPKELLNATGQKTVTVEVGTVTTGETGTEASVINSNTEINPVLDFTIPRGDKGEQGEQGIQGEKGEKGADGLAIATSGTFFLSGDGGNLYAEYNDSDSPPKFEVDENNNIYYLVGDD